MILKSIDDHQFDRAQRWFRANYGEGLLTPPGHIVDKFRSQEAHLKDEIADMRKAEEARFSNRRPRKRKAKAQQTAEEKAREERRKLNGTPKRQRIINKMSNHQRNAWAKAGYPADKATFNRFAASALRRLNGWHFDLRTGKTYDAYGKVVKAADLEAA